MKNLVRTSLMPSAISAKPLTRQTDNSFHERSPNASYFVGVFHILEASEWDAVLLAYLFAYAF